MICRPDHEILRWGEGAQQPEIDVRTQELSGEAVAATQDQTAELPAA
jgi:hypothetical protein